MYRWWSGAACHISLLSLVMMTLKEGCLILFNASLRKRVFPSFLCLSFSPPPFAPDERRRLRLVVRDERSIKIRHIVDVGSRIRNHVWTHRHEKNDDDTSGVVLSPIKKTDFQLNSRFLSTAPQSLEFSWHFQNSAAFRTLSPCLFWLSKQIQTHEC